MGSNPSSFCPMKFNNNKNIIIEKKAKGSCFIKNYPSAIIPRETIRSGASGDLGSGSVVEWHWVWFSAPTLGSSQLLVTQPHEEALPPPAPMFVITCPSYIHMTKNKINILKKKTIASELRALMEGFGYSKADFASNSFFVPVADRRRNSLVVSLGDGIKLAQPP